MNKLFALLFLFGAIGGFGMAAKRTPYQVQKMTPMGAPVGPVRTAYVYEGERIFYAASGLACLIVSAYFVVQVRKQDSRRFRHQRPEPRR